jgi:hypothetical protein
MNKIYQDYTMAKKVIRWYPNTADQLNWHDDEHILVQETKMRYNYDINIYIIRAMKTDPRISFSTLFDIVSHNIIKNQANVSIYKQMIKDKIYTEPVFQYPFQYDKFYMKYMNKIIKTRSAYKDIKSSNCIITKNIRDAYTMYSGDVNKAVLCIEAKRIWCKNKDKRWDVLLQKYTDYTRSNLQINITDGHIDIKWTTSDIHSICNIFWTDPEDLIEGNYLKVESNIYVEDRLFYYNYDLYLFLDDEGDNPISCAYRERNMIKGHKRSYPMTGLYKICPANLTCVKLNYDWSKPVDYIKLHQLKFL